MPGTEEHAGLPRDEGRGRISHKRRKNIPRRETVNTKAKTSLWEERKRIRLVGMWTTGEETGVL